MSNFALQKAMENAEASINMEGLYISDFCKELCEKLMKKEIKSLLLVSTGALMSTTSSLQGESIPGIAHAVAIEFK